MEDFAACFALFSSLVVASGAARLTVHKAVGANAYVDDRLAEAAEFLALAIGFGLFTLRTTSFDLCVSATHEANVARSGRSAEMTLVIAISVEIVHSESLAVTLDF